MPSNSKTWCSFALQMVAAAAVSTMGGSTAHAQQYQLQASVIAAGGGSSTGGSFGVTGTIAEPVVGQLAGGVYSIEGGFMAMVVTVQTTGAPLLTVTRSGSDIVLTWPASDGGYSVEKTSTLQNTASWQSQGATPTLSNDVYRVVIPITPGYLFFRLRK